MLYLLLDLVLLLQHFLDVLDLRKMAELDHAADDARAEALVHDESLHYEELSLVHAHHLFDYAARKVQQLRIVVIVVALVLQECYRLEAFFQFVPLMPVILLEIGFFVEEISYLGNTDDGVI